MGVVSETVFRAPDPRLDGIVAGEYQGWTETSVEVVRRREVPICAIPFIINFGSRFRLFDPARATDGPRMLGIFVAGMYDSFVIVDSRAYLVFGDGHTLAYCVFPYLMVDGVGLPTAPGGSGGSPTDHAPFLLAYGR